MSALTRRSARTVAAVAVVTLAQALTGCSHHSATHRSGAPPSTPASPLHVVATLHVDAAGTVLPTAHRLWVLAGHTGQVMQVDPATDKVTKVVTLPHPAAYGTLARGSLWLVSMEDNALMELDAESGTLLRTLERSPALPLSRPGGIVAQGGTLWVLGHDSGDLMRVDPRTGRATETTRLAGHKAGGPILAGGSLWVGMSKEGIVYQVDPADGRVVDDPVRIDTGLCVGASVVDDAIWFTSQEDPTGVFHCLDGASRLDATSRAVTPLPAAEGRSLYSFARYDGSLWATDLGRGLYRVDERTGSLRRVLTMPGTRDANRLFAAFGSLWMTRSEHGEVLRLESS